MSYYYPDDPQYAYYPPHSYPAASSSSASGPNDRPDPNRVTTFPRYPPPCNRPQPVCPEHDHHYRVMMQGLRDMEIFGLEDLEYIYSPARGADMWADMILEEFRVCNIRRCVFEHFGVLPGPGLLPHELATGTDGRIPVGGRSERQSGERRGGGRREEMVEDDDSMTVASWGNVSRPDTTRRASTAGGTRSNVRSSRRRK